MTIQNKSFVSGPFAAALVVTMSVCFSAGSADAQEDSEIQRGVITNHVHPGDPVQEVSVAGFETLEGAMRFVTDGFAQDRHEPVLDAKLLPGQTVSFAGSSYLVFYHYENDQPTLFSITRCHADLHLSIGSCGFQFTLSVITYPTAPAPVEPIYPER